jgi:hypothetical protein
MVAVGHRLSGYAPAGRVTPGGRVTPDGRLPLGMVTVDAPLGRAKSLLETLVLNDVRLKVDSAEATWVRIPLSPMQYVPV